MSTLAEQIAETMNKHNFGIACAMKRGRNPLFPYVPVIDYGEQFVGVHRTRTEQIRGRAYKTKEEAIAVAEYVISLRKVTLVANLSDPRYRALRVSYGLPSLVSTFHHSSKGS